jgi:WhiB family redox-sensing transcriptional regulator
MVVMWSPVFDWDDDGWRDHAACRDLDPDLFFPAGATGPAVDQIEAAKAFCASCPVREACLQFALETNQDAGIWGGADEEERRKLRRSWRSRRIAGRSAAARQGPNGRPGTSVNGVLPGASYGEDLVEAGSRKRL